MQYTVAIGGRRRIVSVRKSDGHLVVLLDGHESPIDAVRVDAHTLSLLVGTTSHEVALATDPISGQLAVAVDGVRMAVALGGRRHWGQNVATEGETSPQRIVAPMPGKVARVLVGVGDNVQPRQPVVVIEAMKMENELRTSRAGSVAEVHVGEGQSVEAGALLIVVRSA